MTNTTTTYAHERRKAGATVSVQAIKWAMRQRTDGIATKAALLVLAEYANSAGQCWPAVTSLAADACTDERTMRRLLGRLSEAGLITIERRTGRPSVYRLNVETPGPQPGVTPGSEPGVDPAADDQPRGDTPGSAPGVDGDTPGSEPGGVGVRARGGRGVTPPNHHEPLLNRKDSSSARAARRGAERPTAAELDVTAHSPTAHTLVGAWCSDRSLLAPQRRELTRAVDGLLRAGADPGLIPAALTEAHDNLEWKNPTASLRFAYQRVERLRHSAAQPAPVISRSTADDRVAAAQALKTQLRALPGGA